MAIVTTLATSGYLDTHGHTLALLRLLDAAIDVVRGVVVVGADTADLHHLLSKRGNACYNQGDFAAAVELYREALPLSPTGQRRVVVLSVIAKVLAEDGQHDERRRPSSRRTRWRVIGRGRHDADPGGAQRGSVPAARLRPGRELTERGVELARALVTAAEAIFPAIRLGQLRAGRGGRAALPPEAMAIAVDANNEHPRPTGAWAPTTTPRSATTGGSTSPRRCSCARLGQTRRKRGPPAHARFGYLTDMSARESNRKQTSPFIGSGARRLLSRGSYFTFIPR